MCALFTLEAILGIAIGASATGQETPAQQAWGTGCILFVPGVYMSAQPGTCTWAMLGDSGLVHGLLGVHGIHLILSPNVRKFTYFP